MKNLFTVLLLIVFAFNTNAQDSKFYIGLGGGYASASGAVADEGYKGGLYLKLLDVGLRFNETWGVTLGLASSTHTDEDIDDLGIGLTSFAIGPMYSVDLGNIRWDFKPQYAFTFAMYKKVQTAVGLVNIDFMGSAWIIGNSFVFGDGGKGFAWSIDLDYRSGKITETGGDEVSDAEGVFYPLQTFSKTPINNFMIGAGLRYNF